MYLRSLLITSLGLAQACGTSEPAGPEVLHHDWTGIAIQPREEIASLCASWTLDNPAPIHVNAVTMANGGGFHHSNWYFTEDSHYDGPDGVWPCDDRNFDQLSAVVTGGVLAAQSTQSTHETQGFPAGAAFTLPAHARIVGNLHLLNAGEAAIESTVSLEIATLPEDAVEVFLNPMMFDYQDLAIPPHASSRFTMTCDLEKSYGAPLDFNFYYMLPHYHALGTGVRFEGLTGGGDAMMIYQKASAIGEILSAPLDPIIAASGIKDIRFSCDFTNPRDDTVGAGIGDQEMCIMIAWTDSPYIWGAFARMDTHEVDGSDGVRQYEAPCNVAAIPH